MIADIIRPKSCDRRVLWELAKEIYALHCAVKQLTFIPNRKKYQDELIEKLKLSFQKFSACGGIIETGVDNFDEKGPILSYPDTKEVIRYEIGQMRCKGLLNF